MTRFSPFRYLLISMPLALGGCGLTDWADANMPVIGQRCEHWQCFTQSGQQESKANEEQRLHPQSTPYDSGQPAPAATPGGAPAQTPPAPAPAAQNLAPATPDEPTNTYVPRTRPAPGTTPFDGQIQPLEQ